MKVITLCEMEWNEELGYYVVTHEESHEYIGPVGVSKGGGGKGIIGTALTVVAAVFAPYAAPALGAAMGASATVGYAAYGALAGAAISGISGGDPLKGALMGGLGGAAGGYLSGLGGGAGSTAGATAANSTAGLAGPTVGGATLDVAGGFGAAPTGLVAGDAGANALAGPTMNGPTLDVSTGTSGGLTNFGSSGTTNSLGNQLGGVQGPTQAGGNISGYNYTGSGLQGPTPAGGTLDRGSGSFTDRLKQGASDAWNKATSPEALGQAGLKLGTQVLGAALNPTPDLSGVNSYLNDVRGMQQQANQFNISQAEKKSAIGDQLATTAANYNPEYYALQAENSSKTNAASGWADTEQRLRAQGYDDNYINAMRQKYQLGASQNAGTAYDSGWQKGQGLRTQTYGAAGGMYGQVSPPQAGLTSDYLALYQQGNKNANATGSALEQLFGGNSSTTGSATTRNKTVNPQ